MLSRFKEFIAENNLISTSDYVLLGVSGGIDSCVMTDLFARSGINFAIAHCNFQLRGEEADADKQYVKKLAEKYKVHFYTTEFETMNYSKEEGISIQMAARDLRYNWFRQIASKGFSSIAVAHNRDDLAETMLLNLIRGTGLNGLTGIKPKNDLIIRPLLFIGRSEIEEYAIKEKIVYREDSSNKDSKYYRNLIRNEIIPLMKKINPSILETLDQEAEIFTSTYSLYQKEIQHIREAIVLEEGARLVMSIPKIISLRLKAPTIYELIMPYEFTYTDAQNLLRSLPAESGKTFYSAKYLLLKDRTTIIIKKKDSSDIASEFIILEGCTQLDFPISLKLDRMIRSDDFIIPASLFIVAVDADKIKFPLKLRKWKKGDYFNPLGMKGRKKLSDFFIDKKMDIIKKNDQWLLISGDDIIWIIGCQIDDRFKINNNTKNILLLTLKD
jgi:tRNA(Ile)-lysidine synthase